MRRRFHRPNSAGRRAPRYRRAPAGGAAPGSHPQAAGTNRSTGTSSCPAFPPETARGHSLLPEMAPGHAFLPSLRKPHQDIHTHGSTLPTFLPRKQHWDTPPCIPPGNSAKIYTRTHPPTFLPSPPPGKQHRDTPGRASGTARNRLPPYESSE